MCVAISLYSIIILLLFPFFLFHSHCFLLFWLFHHKFALSLFTFFRIFSCVNSVVYPGVVYFWACVVEILSRYFLEIERHKQLTVVFPINCWVSYFSMRNEVNSFEFLQHKATMNRCQFSVHILWYLLVILLCLCLKATHFRTKVPKMNFTFSVIVVSATNNSQIWNAAFFVSDNEQVWRLKWLATSAYFCDSHYQEFSIWFSFSLNSWRWRGGW